MTLSIAVLAGGMATRLGELVADKPKCMIRAGREPFISHLMTKLAKDGTEQVVLCIG